MSKKLLIVDDERDLGEILQFNMENEGFSVECAYSGEEALKKITKGYDLVLMDIMMEGMSGFKTVEKIRKEFKINVPVIFLTARDTENDMLTGFSIGADDYISKPFSIKEVIARVKAVLKRSDATPKTSGLIEFDSLTADIEKKKVTVSGQEVSLTKKEFEILILFLKSPGKIFSRQDILTRIWIDEGYVLERTVDVHITRLRKKLGDTGKCIINRPGYGYCMEMKSEMTNE